MDKKYIKNIQGKEYVLFEGLLNEFHVNGGKEIRTEIISKEPLIIRATVTGSKGTFQGMGDASKENVSSMVAAHIIRMAETRSLTRALRFYNNIGSCSTIELGGKDHPENVPESKKPKSTSTKEQKTIIHKCSDCGVKISERVFSYSTEKMGKALCFKCQKGDKQETESQPEYETEKVM